MNEPAGMEVKQITNGMEVKQITKERNYQKLTNYFSGCTERIFSQIRVSYVKCELDRVLFTKLLDF